MFNLAANDADSAPRSVKTQTADFCILTAVPKHGKAKTVIANQKHTLYSFMRKISMDQILI